MTAVEILDEIERRLEIRLSGTDAARLASPSGAEDLLELIRRWRDGEKPAEALDLLALLDPAAIARVATRVLGDYEADLRSDATTAAIQAAVDAVAAQPNGILVPAASVVSQRPARRRK